MTTWYENSPERYRTELEALRTNKILFDEDEKAKAQGYLRLFIKITEESYVTVPEKFLPLNLIAVFPERYPFFRPEVSAQELSLARHQNPFGKNLCLIPRSTGYWLPEHTLVKLLQDQLWKVLTDGEKTDKDLLKGNTEEQAEPISEYYLIRPNAPIVFDPSAFDEFPLSDTPIDFLGTISLRLYDRPTFPRSMVVIESFDKAHNSIAKLPDKLKHMLWGEVFRAPIYRLTKAPPYYEAKDCLNWLIRELEEDNDKLWERRQPKLSDFVTVEKIVGLTFPEEIEPGVEGWGWLFIVSFKGRTQLQSSFTDEAYFAKISHITSDASYFRIPKTKKLSGKRVAVFGLGALGAPATVEFAKNNIGELAILDYDYVDMPTAVRWSLGFRYVGELKTDAIKSFIEENYPFTKVSSYNLKIGSPRIDHESLLPGGHVSESSQIHSMLKDASLIFDATAETGVNHILSEEAKKRNIPYVSLYATPGVWGGLIMRVIPESKNGCWMCLQYALEEGMVQKPPSDPNGSIQAAGCGDITFTGTSYELQTIVTAAVRLAITTLCADDEKKVFDLRSDISVLSLVDDTGKPISAYWSDYNITVHAKCPYCNGKEADSLDK